ncbi:MAG: PIN domain-containing protein [Acidimicrobiia bacterium]|nr:PIN domain-containing protein [Acidimicrobiia bacterium]
MLLDTNVLLYAACSSYAEHAHCRRLLEGIRGKPDPWFLTWPIVYEFLRVVTHPRVLAKPWSAKHAWAFVEALLASPSLTVLSPTGRHAAVARDLFKDHSDLRGNILHDAHTAILMREHGIRTILTRDMGFHRFGFLDVADPLHS